MDTMTLPGRRRLGPLLVIALAALMLAATTTAAGAAPMVSVGPATAVTLASSSTVLSFGSAVVLTGRASQGTSPVEGQSVTFLAHPAGAVDTRPVGQAVTGPDGLARLRLVPTASTSYRAVTGSLRSASLRVAVRAAVTSTWSAPAVRVGARLSVRGTVRPAAARTPVWVERWVAGHWRVMARTLTSSTGGYRTTLATRSTRGFTTYRVLVPVQARLSAGAGPALRLDSYTLHTYVVRTRGTVSVDVPAFAASAAATYADARGWRAAHHRFARVSRGGAFTLVIAQARYLPSYSSACSARYSCRVGRYVIINQDRWGAGSAPFTGPLSAYRQMVLNHETGHWLGLHHAYCARAGTLAPVMQQQSKGLAGCPANPSPLAGELRAVT